MEVNGNRYLTLVLTNKSKEKIKKYEKMWIKTRDLIRSKTLMIMMMDVWKQNLIQIINYL